MALPLRCSPVARCSRRGAPTSVRGGLPSAELYNPATGSWTATGSMTTGRFGQSATLLQNDQVLVAGGSSFAGYTAELYNPATGSWTATGNMPNYHQNADAPLLPNGQVLVVGGNTNSFPELYDPSSGQFTAVAGGGVNFAARLLGTGKVLVAGGTAGYHPATVNSAELYDPSTQSWASTGSMSVSRETETMTVLSNGQALVTGG